MCVSFARSRILPIRPERLCAAGTPGSIMRLSLYLAPLSCPTSWPCYNSLGQSNEMPMDPVLAQRMEKELLGRAVGGWVSEKFLGNGKSALVLRATHG